MTELPITISRQQHRLLLDDAGVALHVRDVGNAVGERGDVGCAADLLELRALGELVLQREHVDLAVLLRELAHGGENRAVGVLEEVLDVDQPDHAIERVVVDQD
jgi:hypothetical protein